MGWWKAPRIGSSRANSRQAHEPNRPRGPPLNLYIDTSALVKLYVEETGSASFTEHMGNATVVATSWIAYAEARAAFGRRRRVGDLSPTEYRRAVRGFEADWERYVRFDVTIELIRDAAGVAERRHLRAHDAIHLASALAASRTLGGALLFACSDDRLNTAALREGLALSRA
jgi:predicted nucleic acid-binding protein